MTPPDELLITVSAKLWEPEAAGVGGPGDGRGGGKICAHQHINYAPTQPPPPPTASHSPPPHVDDKRRARRSFGNLTNCFPSSLQKQNGQTKTNSHCRLCVGGSNLLCRCPKISVLSFCQHCSNCTFIIFTVKKTRISILTPSCRKKVFQRL